MCGGAVSLQALDRVSGVNPPLKITTVGMPAAKCSRGHAVPVDDDFMLWLIRELKSRAGSLPAGTESGLPFLKKYRCACGADLAGKSERAQVFPMDLAYGGAPAFKAEFEVPVYKCTACGKEQVRSHQALSGHISFAIAGLNDAAGFPHSA
jgi:hypothetical protein